MWSFLFYVKTKKNWTEADSSGGWNPSPHPHPRPRSRSFQTDRKTRAEGVEEDATRIFAEPTHSRPQENPLHVFVAAPFTAHEG